MAWYYDFTAKSTSSSPRTYLFYQIIPSLGWSLHGPLKSSVRSQIPNGIPKNIPPRIPEVYLPGFWRRKSHKYRWFSRSMLVYPRDAPGQLLWNPQFFTPLKKRRSMLQVFGLWGRPAQMAERGARGSKGFEAPWSRAVDSARKMVI